MQLHYENMAGMLVRRKGKLHWRCPKCGREGASEHVLRECPECKAQQKPTPNAEVSR